MDKQVKHLLDMMGKVAVITGGFANLGFDIASALAEYGCMVVITSRKKEKAQDAAARIQESYGVDALGLEMDQQCYSSVSNMAERAIAWKGHVDVLVNNAGGGAGYGECDFFKRTPEDMASMIQTNLIGALFCCQVFCRNMAQRKSGTIINLGSIAAIVGRDREMYIRGKKMQQPVDYAAAKGGVVGMTRDLAAYMAPFHVRVNALSPGAFDCHELPRTFTEAFGEATPLGRLGQIGCDIKGAALFLASDASAYVTGHNLVVDGGFSICK